MLKHALKKKKLMLLDHLSRKIQIIKVALVNKNYKINKFYKKKKTKCQQHLKSIKINIINKNLKGFLLKENKT